MLFVQSLFVCEYKILNKYDLLHFFVNEIINGVFLCIFSNLKIHSKF